MVLHPTTNCNDSTIGECSMFQRFLLGLTLYAYSFVFAQPLSAQVRVTPQNAKGGRIKYGEPWVGVPESFRNLGVPDWPVPTDLSRWQEIDRPKTRKILFDCL